MYIVKAAETMFVQKMRMYNVDEIDGRSTKSCKSFKIIFANNGKRLMSFAPKEKSRFKIKF